MVKFGLSFDRSGVEFGLSFDRSGVEFGLSCDRSGVEFGLSCDRICERVLPCVFIVDQGNSTRQVGRIALITR